jgi:ribosomal protein S18 acetylase RimI-like enzyme
MMVRLASLSDLNQCLALGHDSETHHVWQMQVQETERAVGVTFDTVRLPRGMTVRYPRDLDQLIDDWQRGEGFLVAEAEGKIRGYVDVLARRWEGTAWVANLAVDVDYRRQGIGRRLMGHAEQWAREQGLGTVVVETSTKNYPAVSFYEALGFAFCGFNDRYYVNQDIALFFAKSLR